MKTAMIAFLLLSTATAPLLAQPMPVEKRVDKLEKEMKAVQRKVFPGGAQKYFEPEIQPQVAPPTSVGVPAETAVTDLTRRVDALEKALAAMTGQVEQNGFNLRKLEEQFAKMKGDAEFRLNALEGKPPPGGPVAGAAAPTGANLPYIVPPLPPAPAGGSTADIAAVAPAPSADPGYDAYLVGFRLWEQKKYPEAIAALKAMYTKYPKHKHASFARNLAGRAYLDSGQYNEAIREFFENTKIEDGERAPHSYVYMAQALLKRKPPLPDKACQAYEVLLAKYPDKVTGGLADLVAKGKADAKCP